MSRITLYDQPNLTGKSLPLTANVSDLAKKSFENVTRSLKVEGCPWVVYDLPLYTGAFRIYKPGEYTNLGDFAERITSVQQITVSLENPEIVLYQHINYQGSKVSLFEANENVKTAGLDSKVSAHEVKRGAWILYMETRFRGKRIFTMDDQPNYPSFGWNDQLYSLKPVTEDDCDKPQ